MVLVKTSTIAGDNSNNSSKPPSKSGIRNFFSGNKSGKIGQAYSVTDLRGTSQVQANISSPNLAPPVTVSSDSSAGDNTATTNNNNNNNNNNNEINHKSPRYVSSEKVKVSESHTSASSSKSKSKSTSAITIEQLNVDSNSSSSSPTVRNLSNNPDKKEVSKVDQSAARRALSSEHREHRSKLLNMSLSKQQEDIALHCK